VPFLRVLRDKRGYETTYLMHWFREGVRQRSRVLYVFRTPGHVKVGRMPLDPDALRQIEARYPDIDFDWNAVRENQQVIEPSPEFRRRRPRRDDGETPEVVAPAAGAAGQSAAAPQAPPPPPKPVFPSAISGATPDEQVAFLTEWYPRFRDRVALKTADPSRREALLALAERLNPAAWTDADQRAAGLPVAAEALERLSRVLARRRRRARKRAASEEGAEAGGPAAPSEPVPPDS
jgi:hypothetical protein